MTHGVTATVPEGRASTILEWWRTVTALLRELRERAHRSETTSAELAWLAMLPDSEREERFEAFIAETREQARFTLFATAEALLMNDYATRRRGRKADTLGSGYRALAKRAKTASFRVTLDQVLAECRHRRPEAGAHVKWLEGALSYRHWLGHGRYWEPKLASQPLDPDQLSARLALVFGALGIPGWA